jgi:hypothetical protein
VTQSTDQDDDRPIAHHYALVLIVEAVTLTALWLASVAFR